MRLNRPVCSVLVVSAVSVFWSEARANQPQVDRVYGKLPLSFEVNRGQTDPRVKFISRGNGYTLFLAPTEAVLSLRSTRAQVLRIKLLGANAAPIVNGLERLPGQSNYFIGRDPRKWHTNVSTFAKVKYEHVYPGIDLVYYGNQGSLEHDFIVAPGADPRKIRMRVLGASQRRLDSGGDLLLTTAEAIAWLHKPRVYQDQDGGRQPIQGNYVLIGEDQVGFEVSEYDASRPLIIDPMLSYSTYLGAQNDDFGY